MNFFINSRLIRAWAATKVAQSTLPHVIRRLVWATLAPGDIQRIDFPAYESVQRPGFDGEVQCNEGNPWVPAGHSVWELSVEAKVGRKADGDYATRTNETPVEVKRATTFVCLTGRHWKKKKAWEEEKRKLGEWRDVRAFDADDIEQWVERGSFGFIAWLGRQIGSRPTGVDDIGQRWEAISRFAVHPLVPKVYLAGRDQSLKQIREWLNARPTHLQIACRSLGEVIDFFCAAIASMDENDRVRVESQAVIINSIEAWTQLRDTTSVAILVIEPSIPLSIQEIMQAVANGHYVLTAIEPATLTGEVGPELERANQWDLKNALEESGFTPVEAEQHARSAGGSLAILKYRLARSWLVKPDWSANISPEVLAACLLLGGWGNNSSDKDAFSRISGRPFAQCEAELQLISGTREPLLLHAADNWRLISKDHAWTLFQDRITPTLLTTFEKLAIEILSDDDPRYQLPRNQRFYANISGYVPRYSATIKANVAETLAFLGEFGSRLQAATSIDVTSSVDRIVSLVLTPTCSWQRWASIGSKLPLLAEASPRSFLNAAQSDLNKEDSELVKLLHEEENSFFGKCNHAGLLWALECLAWQKSYLPNVATLLMALAKRDVPKGKWGNRPFASLCEILSYWHPQTMATVDERIQALDLLIQADGDVVWSLMLTLLPHSIGGFSHPIRRPYWRDWANEWESGAPIAESEVFIEATADRVIQQAGTTVERWRQVFENIGRLPYSAFEQLYRALDSFCGTHISDANRRILWEELWKQVNAHRSFPNSHWALPEEIVNRLESYLGLLQPQDAVMRHAWIFERWPDRFFDRGGNHSENEAALEKARLVAIQEILDELGYAGVTTLIEKSESASVVGNILGTATRDTFLPKVVPICLDGSLKELDFASGFIWNRFFPDHWDWVDKCLAQCGSANSKANLLRCLPFSRPVWERADSAGIEVSRAYWERCQAFNPRLDSADVETAVTKLIEHGRPASTLDILSMALHNKRELSYDALLSPLESLLLLSPERSREQFRQAAGYDIQDIIAELQARNDVPQDRLLRIEWHFLRLLDRHQGHSAQTLQKHLSASPAFFNEVLSCCYPPDESEDQEEEEATDHHQHMSQQAFHLLHDWDRMPGMKDDGSIDESQLRAWCTEARRISEGLGRLRICDAYLGKLFAKCKSQDADGTWPCTAVRRLASEINSNSFASGMACGIQSLRGAVFRVKDGGSQERSLAQQFREKADRIRFNSPYVAQILDSVVEAYDRQAKWWDEQDRWNSG